MRGRTGAKRFARVRTSMRGASRVLGGGRVGEGAVVLRHLAILLAATMAYALRLELTVSRTVLCILALSVALNMGADWIARRPGAGMLVSALPAAVSISSWGLLVAVTGGAASPFVAGFHLEIAFSALRYPPLGIGLVTVATVAAAWLQQAHAGFDAAMETRLWLQTGMLILSGALTSAASHRWLSSRRRLSHAIRELEQRRLELERQLEDGQVLYGIGQNAARQAHSLK